MIARRRRRRPQKRSSSPAASLGHTHGQFQPPGSSAPTESLPRGRQAHQPHHLGLLQLPQAPGSSQLLGMCKAHRGQGGHGAWFPAFWDRQTVPTELLRGVRPSVWGGLQLNLTRASRRSRVCHSGSGQSPAPEQPWPQSQAADHTPSSGAHGQPPRARPHPGAGTWRLTQPTLADPGLVETMSTQTVPERSPCAQRCPGSGSCIMRVPPNDPGAAVLIPTPHRRRPTGGGGVGLTPWTHTLCCADLGQQLGGAEVPGRGRFSHNPPAPAAGRGPW